MRIFLSGYHNPHFLTITEYIERAIEKLGHALTRFDDRKFIFPGRLRERLAFLEQFELNNLNKKLVGCVHSSKPDLIIVTGGHRIRPGTLKQIKKLGVKTVLWTIDSPKDFQPILRAVPIYDHIFCQGSEAVELLAQAGINGAQLLPMGCDPEFHRPAQVTDEEFKSYGRDVVFVGSYYPNRAALFRKLADFNLGIWGPGWGALAKNDPLRMCLRGGSVTPEEFKKIYSTSKIVVICHYQDGKTPCYQASPKLFEAMACQSFVLVDRQPDVMSLFTDGKHVRYFSTADEARDLIHHYLRQADERDRIARNGRAEVIENHTYVHRIRNLLKHCFGAPVKYQVL